jgi:hypothetical protein
MTFRRLDLDDVGPVVAEQPTGEEARLIGEVEDANAREVTFVHRR